MSLHLFTTQDLGLANRLRGYVGAWAYAKSKECKLHVLWSETPACPYRIEELFEPLPNTQFITSEIAAANTYEHTTMDHGLLSGILKGHNIQNSMGPLFIASLIPTETIRKKLKYLLTIYPISEAIGIHIRRTDHTEYANNTISGKTPDEVFWNLADNNPTCPIFLACDDPETVVQWKAKYGARVLTAKAFSPAAADSLRKSDGEHAVLDIYCLSLCREFQGSHASSFSAHVNYLRSAWTLSSSLRKRLPSPEKIVFSFSLYGDRKKYTEGMVINAQQISVRFPSARIQIYIADDVPADIKERLSKYPTVRLVPVKRLKETQNTLDRFFALDDPDCDILISRDADSRVHARDAACIEDFIVSDKPFHIIRDHRCHAIPVLAGMWGMRKKALPRPITGIIQQWLAANNSPSKYGCDQQFLWKVIYPAFVKTAMIHDSIGHYKQLESTFQPFRVPVINKLFVGQVHDFNERGEEVLECGVE